MPTSQGDSGCETALTPTDAMFRSFTSCSPRYTRICEEERANSEVNKFFLLSFYLFQAFVI